MFTRGHDAFATSLALKKSPEALRNLAIVSHALEQHDAAFEHYYNALVLLAKEGGGVDTAFSDAAGARLLIRDIAAEATYHFALLGYTNHTTNLTSTRNFVDGNIPLIPDSARHSDRFRFATVQVISNNVSREYRRSPSLVI
eukprot:m.154310 g.154310  ORF g.154310 m.154310 type:complete len:142 (+) comp17920_c0_seq28:2247-2672(+)